MNNQKKLRSNAAVTLIEMLVVVTIIALFATLVAPGMFKQGDKAKAVAARVQINNFEQALTQYKLNTGLFPTTEQGLEALRTKPSNVNQWEGPRSEEHTSELQSHSDLVCRLLLEKKNKR